MKGTKHTTERAPYRVERQRSALLDVDTECTKNMTDLLLTHVCSIWLVVWGELVPNSISLPLHLVH